MKRSPGHFWAWCRNAGLSLAFGLTVTAPAMAAVSQLVQNGSFAVTGGTKSVEFGTYGNYTPTETVAGWSTTGYNFVFLPSDTVATGAYGNLSLYSATTTPSNSFNNASPTGGNYIGADAAYGTAAITQTINGLTVGQTYAVSFAWAGGQQTGYTGGTTEQWGVTLGSSTTQYTQTVSVPSTGFSGWMNQTFTFVANNTSELLSFLANGTPSGVPPFALLANVSMTQVPEPATLPLILTGLVALAAIARRPRGDARIG